MKDTLEDLYVRQEKTIAQIAVDLNKSQATISRWLKKYGIQTIKGRRNQLSGFYNDWEIIGPHPNIVKNGVSVVYWLCRCKCGTIKPVSAAHLTGGYSTKCKNCSSKNFIHNPNSISLTYFNDIKNGAIRRNKEFNLTREFLWELFEKQNRKCALSGEEIYFAEKVLGYNTASLDRIDSKRGYVKDNVQWVHINVNKMKMDLEENMFIEFCVKIARNRGVV